MNKKPYLTVEQVKREARRSLKAAIRCSLRHWQELRDATHEELADKVIYPTADHCALCSRFFFDMKCEGCPLDDRNENCFDDDSVYNTALESCKEFVIDDCFMNERFYRRAAQDVVTVLQDCLRKVENEVS